MISIGSEAFAKCSGLRELILPEGVEAIGIGAFVACVNLSVVSLLSK